MKKFKKYIVISIVLFIIGFVAYNELPEYGSLNKLILSKYSHSKFEHVDITQNFTLISSNDVEPLNKLFSYLGDFKIIEDKHLKHMPAHNLRDGYYIYTYADDFSTLIIMIESRNYMTIETCREGNSKLKSYKIIGNGLDMKHIDSLLKQIKPDKSYKL